MEVLAASLPFGVEARRHNAPFIGRARELEILRAALERVRTERAPRLVTLIGVPGIGKTQLLRQLGRQVAEGQAEVVWHVARTPWSGAGTAFSPLAEMVRHQLRIADGDASEVGRRKPAAGLAPHLRTRPNSIHSTCGKPMKVPVNSIRAGNVIEYNGRLWVASKVQHITPGKGGAFVQLEAKALREGNKLQERFRSGETIDRVHIDERECTYLFKDDTGFTFMDKESFEQLTVPAGVLD